MQQLSAYPTEFPAYQAQRLREVEENSYDVRFFPDDALARFASGALGKIHGVWRQPPTATAQLFMDENQLPKFPPLEALLNLVRLAARDQAILLLAYKENKTNTEIAAILPVTHQRISQLRAWAQRAVKKYYASHIKHLRKQTPLQIRLKLRRVVTSSTAGS